MERALDMMVMDWHISFVFSKSNRVTLDEGEEDHDDDDDKDSFRRYLFCAYNASDISSDSEDAIVNKINSATVEIASFPSMWSRQETW